MATFAAVMFGVPAEAAYSFRTPVIAVIGIMLGSGFSVEVISNIGHWILSLSFLAVYLAIAAAIVVPFYMRVGNFDRVTAYFAAMPGGLNDMMLIGEAMGGDARRIILAHAARVVITVAVVAFWFRVVLGLEVSGNLGMGNGAPLGGADVAILLACAVAGVYLGKWLRFPAPGLMGPMLLSAIVHISDVTHSVPPRFLVIAAQVYLGTMMGCRFVGAPKAMVLRSMLLSFGATLITLSVTLVFALAFHKVFGQTAEQVILAFAPGGLTEMSLVALSMNAEVAYISVHHLVRIVMVIGFAPVVMRLLMRWRA